MKARVIGRRPADTSFPSGHSAAAFAGALLLTPHLANFGILFFAFAVLVSISRVYLGVHYPSDIVVGGLLGSFLAVFFGTIVRLVIPL